MGSLPIACFIKDSTCGVWQVSPATAAVLKQAVASTVHEKTRPNVSFTARPDSCTA